ncbi:shikimate kinase [Fervidobacterium sp.]
MNLFVTGLPGSGKSHIAKILKDDFGYKVIEVENILEIETGKDLYTLIQSNGFKQVAKIERKIVDRFAKSCDRIVIGCGVLYEHAFQNYMIIYIKIPKQNFINRVRKYANLKVLEEHYFKFHRQYSNQAALVISGEHKTKYEIAMIISDFFRKNIIRYENT